MTWKIDERMPWVLVVEMAAHIGAVIDGFQARRAQRKRLVDDLK